MSNLMSYRSKVVVNTWRPRAVCGVVCGAVLHTSQFRYAKRDYQELDVLSTAKMPLGIAVYTNRYLPPHNLLQSSSSSKKSFI